VTCLDCASGLLTLRTFIRVWLGKIVGGALAGVLAGTVVATFYFGGSRIDRLITSIL
jgi:hypothetical protein